VNEDEDLSFHLNDFKSNYGPDQSKFSGLDIRNLPEHGSLIYNGEPISIDDIVNNGGTFRIEQGAINQLVYRPEKDFSGTDAFKWNSFDITVDEVNDPPVITAPSEIANIPEDTPLYTHRHFSE
jgi:hypothetical protein